MVFKVEKLEMVVLSPFSALVYDLPFTPYGIVGRHTQKSIMKRLDAIKLFSFSKLKVLKVLKPFSY